MKISMDLQKQSKMMQSPRPMSQKSPRIKQMRSRTKTTKTILGKKMMMIKINKFKMMSSPKTPNHKKKNQQKGRNQIHKKRELQEAKVRIRVMVVISIKGKCLLETIEIREDKASKTVVVDLKEAVEEVVTIMTDIMIVMIGISLGEEEADMTSKIGEKISTTEEISEIVETSEEEETVENSEVVEITTMKGEEVSRIEEISIMIEETLIRGIIMIKEIIKINATITKKGITQKKENIKTEENIRIDESIKIKENTLKKENSKIEGNSKIKENINMIREIFRKDLKEIMIMFVQMMTINHLTNKNKTEREDFPSEILKMTHQKEITNTNNKGAGVIIMETEIKVMDSKMITEDGHQ